MPVSSVSQGQVVKGWSNVLGKHEIGNTNSSGGRLPFYWPIAFFNLVLEILVLNV